MVKNYAVLVLIALFLFPKGSQSQEIQIFNVEDFDLKGKVKSCLVIANYGKEEYEFAENGLLTKAITRYSDSDYDITYYKYAAGTLSEKRLENYRDNTFDKTTSIANIYTIDSVSNRKITEKILSYDNDFLDQYEYYYQNDTLNRIVRSNNDGIDETLILNTDVKGEQTKTYTLNGVVFRSVRTSLQKEKDSLIEKNVLIKKFIEGEPTSAIEEIYDGREKLISRTKFFYNTKTEQFSKESVVNYLYDERGLLVSTTSTEGNQAEEKEYIYQLDQNNNWIKEIIVPEKTYKTRKITYYEVASEDIKQK